MGEMPQSNPAQNSNQLGRSCRGASDQMLAIQATLNLVNDMRQGNYFLALESGLVAVWAMTDLVGGQIMQKEFFQTDKPSSESPTRILDRVLFILMIVDYLNGLLPPDEGAIFQDGADTFDTAVTTLLAAHPGQLWTGLASNAYVTQRQQLIALTQEIAEVDRAMKSVLLTEAEQVKNAHLFHRAVTYAVTLATPIALALYGTPLIGPEISNYFQESVAFYALNLAADQLISVSIESAENAAIVRMLSHRYKQVFLSAQDLMDTMPSPLDTPDMPGREAAVSGFMDFPASTALRDEAGVATSISTWPWDVETPMPAPPALSNQGIEQASRITGNTRHDRQNRPDQKLAGLAQGAPIAADTAASDTDTDHPPIEFDISPRFGASSRFGTEEAQTRQSA